MPFGRYHIFVLLIQKVIRNSPFFLIIGAGISSPIIKLSSEIIEECKTECKKFEEIIDLPEETEIIDKYSFWFEEAYPTPNLRRQYFENLVKGKPLTPAHLRLAHLLSKKKVANIVVTPNFDDQLSRALWLFEKDHIRYDHPSTIERIDLNRDEIQVIHVHGNYLFYDIKNLKGEIEGTITDSLMIDKLTAIMSQYSPIVIGYSGWEHDIIMTAMRRTIHSTAQNNIYWFCYTEDEIELLPEFLVNNPHVKFVISNKSEMPKRLFSDSISLKSKDKMQYSNEQSCDSSKSPPLTALQVFDSFIREFDCGNPELTENPFNFFISKLQQVDPSFNSVSILDNPSPTDIYSIGMVIRQISQARDCLDLKKENSGKTLITIIDSVRQSNYEKALKICETVDISIFNVDNQIPDFVNAVRNALLNLNLSSENKIILLSKFIENIDKDNIRDIPGIDNILCIALREKGLALAVSERFDDSVEACNEVINRYAKSESPELQVQVARAFIHKSYSLAKLNCRNDAIAVCDEVISRYGKSESLELQVQVAKAFYNKSVDLKYLKRNDDSIAACNEVINNYIKSESPELQVWVTNALFHKGVQLGDLKRFNDAIEVYDEIINRYGKIESPDFHIQVANAFLNKGVHLVDLNRFNDAIAAYDEIINRYGKIESSDFHVQIAKAFFNKGIAFGHLKRHDDSLLAYDEAITRYSKSDTPELRDLVAMALINKGVILEQLNRQNDATTVYDEVITRYGKSNTPELQVQVNKAIKFKKRNSN